RCRASVPSTPCLPAALPICEAPADALLGGEGQGVRNVGGTLSEIRVITAALAIGLGRAALGEAARYARERRAFGRPIGDFQLIGDRKSTRLYFSQQII